MLKFYNAVIQPVFYVGSVPLYGALFDGKYNQLEEEGTDLAESHRGMTTILYCRVEGCMETTAGDNLLYACNEWSDNISTQVFLKSPRNNALPNM